MHKHQVIELVRHPPTQKLCNSFYAWRIELIILDCKRFESACLAEDSLKPQIGLFCAHVVIW